MGDIVEEPVENERDDDAALGMTDLADCTLQSKVS